MVGSLEPSPGSFFENFVNGSSTGNGSLCASFSFSLGALAGGGTTLPGWSKTVVELDGSSDERGITIEPGHDTGEECVGHGKQSENEFGGTTGGGQV